VGLDNSGDDSAEDPLSATASALHAELVGHFAAGTGLPLALYKGRDLPLALLVEPFLEAKKLKPSTAASYRTAFEKLLSVVGEKTASEVTPHDLDHFRHQLELSRSNKGTRKALSATTIRKYCSHIGEFFAAVAGEGPERGNPAATLERPLCAAPSPTSSKQVAFSEEQLARLFAAPIFTGCQDDNHITRPGQVICRDGRYWFAVLKLYAGVRSGESKALMTTDILKHHGIWHIDIHNDSRTGVGNRMVPVHSKLVEMGFLDWVEERRARVGEGSLFEPRKYARIWNDWVLKVVGLKIEGLTVEGLRLNFIEAIASNADDELVRRLSGQSTGASCDRYLTKEDTRRASWIIDRIEY
jgi:site-specific recombinase XerD